MEDLQYSVKIRESILMNHFTRHLQRLVKFWQRRKAWEVDSTARAEWICSVQKIEFKFMFSKKGSGDWLRRSLHFEYLALPVFGKCLKWVLQVCLRRFPVGRAP